MIIRFSQLAISVKTLVIQENTPMVCNVFNALKDALPVLVLSNV